jgi:hypothetical protein
MTAKSAAKPSFAPARQGQAFKDKSKPADIRQSNINAAKGNEILNELHFTSFHFKICEIK